MKKSLLFLTIYLITWISTSQVTVTTLAGSTQGFNDATGANAKFSNPRGVVIDAAGNLYVADSDNNKIRKISPAGVVTTFAGSTQGFADGTGATAKFNVPVGLAIDSAGNLYVGDSNNNKIRKITPVGVVSTIAGSSVGFADGIGALAKFNYPQGLVVDDLGNVYVVDTANHKIRKITSSGIVTTFAGSTSGFADGTGTNAMFAGPWGIAIDKSGNLYVADSNNQRIRKINPAGEVSTLAGSGNQSFADGLGSAAEFNFPSSCAIDASNNLYVSDSQNSKIRKIIQTGLVSTFAGSTAGFADGPINVAKFSRPYGIAIDAVGNIYIADQSNHKIRKITQPLGILQNEVTPKITIYPNPVSKILTMQLENNVILDKICIIDLSGKTILTETQNTMNINVDSLANGMYFLEVNSGSNKFVCKFFKE